MSINDFILVNVRKHTIKENAIVFFCVSKDDKLQQEAIHIIVDEKELPVIYQIKQSNEIRRKYLGYKMNVSQEIMGIVNLPKPLGMIEQVKVVFEDKDMNEKKIILSKKQLNKINSTLDGNQELERIEDGKLILTGWSLAETEDEFKVYVDGKLTQYKITRNFRKDVMDFYPELDNSFEAGYEIEITDNEIKKVKLVTELKGRSNCFEVSVTDVRKGKRGYSKVSLGKKTLDYYKKNGMKRTICKIGLKLKGKKEDLQYEDFLKKHNTSQEELERQKAEEFNYCPKFSIAVPLYRTNPKYLKELIESIQKQTYENWELCLADGSGEQNNLKELVQEYIEKDKRIRYCLLDENLGIAGNTNAALKMVSGDYVALADHDDLLVEETLYQCVKVLNENHKIDVIYSDEDKIDMAGKKLFEPHFKSDFNIDLLCTMNYICHLFVFKKTILDMIGGFRSEYDGAQDHDFIFRCVENAEKIYHIPKVLYHWRCHAQSTSSNPESKLYAFENGAKAVQAHYERLGIPVHVEQGKYYGMYRTHYEWKEQPLVSVIIPNKDHVEDLCKCMEALKKQSYHHYEIIIVENNSTEEETFSYYKQIESEQVHVIYYEGEFNFSKINNFGAEHAKGEYYLLLNNDTEMIGEYCLEELLYPCMRDDVGIVGARLYYADDTIQHAGVVIGFGGMAGHSFIGQDREDNGYFSRSMCTQDLSAVTAACMMTKSSIFKEVQGLDEELQVAFNDIDYCLRVREVGKLVVFNPHAELYHYESKSRGLENSASKLERFNREVAFFVERWEELMQNGDPYYNPNLTLDKADFSLKE